MNCEKCGKIIEKIEEADVGPVIFCLACSREFAKSKDGEERND